MNKEVTAVILAAGIGKRLRGLTDVPKSLLTLNGETLLARHIRIWRDNGIKKIVAVLGYQKELIEAELEKVASDFDIKVVVNEDPVQFGNTHSLWLGVKAIKSGSAVVFDADLAYDDEVVRAFFEDSTHGRILVGENSLDDIECAKALADTNGMIRLTVDKRAVSKEELAQYNFVGEAIGVLWFSPDQVKALDGACQKFLSIPEKQPLNWEHLLNEFLLEHDMKTFMLPGGRWIEIDTSEDYERAQMLFGND